MSLRATATYRPRVVNLFLMVRGKYFVIVEGQSDKDFLGPRMAGRAHVEQLDGRDEVEKACDDLRRHGCSDFVALLDADFNEAVGINQRAPYVVYVSISDQQTDSTIDLESTLIRTRALRQVCGEVLGNGIQARGGPAAFTDDIRESLRVAAGEVGAFRAAVMRIFTEQRKIQGVGELSDSDWEAIVDLDTGRVDHAGLERVMMGKVRNVEKYRDVQSRARDFRMDYGGGWLLCRGHDMTQLLSLRLSRLRGRHISQKDVESMLLNRFNGDVFKETAFGERLSRFCSGMPTIRY
jgi:hypothetical protein